MKRKVGPLYIVAGIWLLWSVFMPLFKISNFVILIIICAIAFSVSKKAFKKSTSKQEEEAKQKMEEAEKLASQAKAKEAEAERAIAAARAAMAAQTAAVDAQGRPIFQKRPKTGNAAIDRMIDDEERAVREMRRLDDAIVDEKISAQIVHFEDVTKKIVSYVIEHPDKQNQVRKFFNYYLPTTIKLLNAYDRMDEAGISGMNIDGTKSKVEDMMDTALLAFDKQLDALYADEALDISTEIKVMEGMLAQEGLTDDELMKAAKKAMSSSKLKKDDYEKRLNEAFSDQTARMNGQASQPAAGQTAQNTAGQTASGMAPAEVPSDMKLNGDDISNYISRH